MTLIEFIKAAEAADTAFESAVKAAGFKSRWDWDYRAPGSFVALRHAYRHKIEADSAMHAAFVRSREEA